MTGLPLFGLFMHPLISWSSYFLNPVILKQGVRLMLTPFSLRPLCYDGQLETALGLRTVLGQQLQQKLLLQSGPFFTSRDHSTDIKA